MSKPASRPHLTRSSAAWAGWALGVCVPEGGGLGDGWAPGFAAPQGAWPGPARLPACPPARGRASASKLHGSRDTPTLGASVGHSGGCQGVGLVWLGSVASGLGRGGGGRGAATLVEGGVWPRWLGSPRRVGARPRWPHPCSSGMGWGWGSRPANEIPGTRTASLRRAPNADERGLPALPGLVEWELWRPSRGVLLHQLLWVCWAVWICSRSHKGHAYSLNLSRSGKVPVLPRSSLCYLWFLGVRTCL